MNSTDSDVVWYLCGTAVLISLFCWSAVGASLRQLYKHRHLPRNNYEAARLHFRDNYVFARWVIYALIATTAAFGGIVSIYDDGTIRGWPTIVVVSLLFVVFLAHEMYRRNCTKYDKLVCNHEKALRWAQKNQ